MMPEIVKSFILSKCRQGKGHVTLVDSSGALKGSLEFNEEGMSKTLTEQFSVVDYINRLVKYSKHDIKILIDGIGLDEKAPMFITEE